VQKSLSRLLNYTENRIHQLFCARCTNTASCWLTARRCSAPTGLITFNVVVIAVFCIRIFTRKCILSLCRPIESHSGARGNILTGPLWRETFRTFFQNCAFWCTLYFWATAGPSNVAEPVVAYHSMVSARYSESPMWFKVGIRVRVSENSGLSE